MLQYRTCLYNRFIHFEENIGPIFCILTGNMRILELILGINFLLQISVTCVGHVPHIYLTQITLWLYINKFKCGKYPRILCGILSAPQNKRVYLDNSMSGRPQKPKFFFFFIQHIIFSLAFWKGIYLLYLNFNELYMKSERIVMTGL